MADKQLRLQYPYPPSGTNYSSATYWPSAGWETSGSLDHPTVSQVIAITNNTVTRKVISIADGSTSYMDNNTSYGGYSASYTGNFWLYDPARRPILTGTSNPMAFIIGHKGVQSDDSTVQSWQRGVVGFSMEHKDTPYSGMYGHYLQECKLLYRKWSDASAFYGVDILSGGNLMSSCKKNYASQSPFKTNNPRRDGSQGGFYVALDENHPAHSAITSASGGYVYLGVYMLWGSYDGNSQFVGKLELWNKRLIFRTNKVSDDGHRVVMPKMWTFKEAGTDNKLKLTYT